MADSSLSDQVKAAERDKYLAEAAKANAEKEKIEFDLSQSKKFFNTKTIWSVILGVGFLGFFITYVVIPAANKENIEISTQNAITKESLRKQRDTLLNEKDSLNKVRTNLNKQINDNKKIADENNKLNDSVNNAKRKLESLKNQTNSLSLLISHSQNQIKFYKSQINSLKPTVDSLENAKSFKLLWEKSGFSFLNLYINFSFQNTIKNSDITPILTFTDDNGKKYLFENDSGLDVSQGFHFLIPANLKYSLSIKSKIYKLPVNKINFDYNEIGNRKTTIEGVYRYDYNVELIRK